MIFGIGLNKTGTTTLGDAAEILGLTRLGARGGAHPLLKAYWAGERSKVLEAAQSYDILEDWPWPLLYDEMAETFSEAKFVLTRRSTTEVWLRSQRQHMATHGVHYRIYGVEREDPDLLTKMGAYYERHNQAVRAYFAGTDRLLEVCWEEGDGWDELAGFLGCPVPDAPFPHSNPAGWVPPPKPVKPSLARRVAYRVLKA